MTSDSPTVLIIEDERDVADLYRVWLQDSYTVRTAYSGEEGLELLDSDVDVVLLDRRMPGLSGDEVLGRIRERPGEYQIALVTAVEPDFDILKLDFDEYLTKPIAREELESMVEDLLTRYSFEHGLQEYMALAAKKKTLEEEKTSAELENSTTYDVLTAELAKHREQFNEELAQLGERQTDSYLPYSNTKIVFNTALIGLVAVLLVAIHFWIPNAKQQVLAFGTSRTDPRVLYLLSFVHTSDAHLYGNIMGYLLSAGLALVLCLRIRAERWFQLTSLLLLTVLPIGTTAIAHQVFDVLYPSIEPNFIGFSAVSAGFIGFSLLAFLIAGRVIYTHRTVFLIGIFIGLVSTSLLLWTTTSRLVPVVIGGLLVVIILLLVENLDVESISWDLATGKRIGRQIIVLLIMTVVYGVFGLGLFPTTPRNTLQISVTGHLLGIVLGIGIAFGTALVSNMFPLEERFEQEGYSLPDRLL